MKKMTVIAAGVLGLGCLGAFGVPAFTLDTSIKFSSEHAFRGYRMTKHAFLPKAEIGFSAFERGRVYGGVDSVLSLGITTHPDKPNIEKNEVAPYLGLSYDVTDVFTLDCGYVCRLWTNMPDSEGETGYRLLTSYHPKKTSNEVYVGVAADVFLSPSVYVAYNYQWRELAVEGRVAYTYDLAQFGVSGVAVEFGAKVGYDKADRPHGLNIGDMKKSGAYGMVQEYARFGKAHWFCGANADLVYSFSEHAKARAGVEVVGNSAARDAWQNLFREYPKKMLWFNASIDCSF